MGANARLSCDDTRTHWQREDIPARANAVLADTAAQPIGALVPKLCCRVPGTEYKSILPDFDFLMARIARTVELGVPHLIT